MISQGTKLKTVREVPSDHGLLLKAGAVLTISEANFFEDGLHLAMDHQGNAWAIDAISIDNEDLELNNFSVITEGT